MKKVAFRYASGSETKWLTFSCDSISPPHSYPDNVAADGRVERNVDVWVEIEGVDVKAVPEKPTHIAYDSVGGRVEYPGTLRAVNETTLKFDVGGEYLLSGKKNQRRQSA
jgi:hypothetical protein